MQKRIVKLYILLALIYTAHLESTPGDLDTTFGTAGVITTNLSRTDYVNSCTVQPDDNIVVAGVANGYYPRIGVTRYTPDGSLDTTFNSTGSRLILIGSGAQAQSITLQSNDKILLTGYASEAQTNVPLVRLNTDGTTDLLVTTAIPQGAVANSILQQPDTNILLGGVAVDGQAYFTLLRYDTAGVLDSGFGTGGIVVTAIGYYATINQIALQSDGKIIAGGNSYGPLGSTFCLARYNTDGTLDTTFGPNLDGTVITVVGSESQINSVVIQSDDYIVVGGYTIDDADGITKFALARYDVDGNLDSSFGTSGIVKTAINYESKANNLLLQPDEKILAGGYSYDDLATGFALARYNTDGSLDTSFGTNGYTVTSIGGHNSESHINSLAIQSTGNIIAAGYSDSAFAVARYLGS